MQAAMVNWGKQSAFDMFSNLMTFQALASQQGQANPGVLQRFGSAAVPGISSAGVISKIHIALIFATSLELGNLFLELSTKHRAIHCGSEAHDGLAALWLQVL